MAQINIYAQSFRLIEILAKCEALPGFEHRYHVHSDSISTEGQNLIITGSLPAELHDNAKYILCTSNPSHLTPSTLSKLYDLWPLPLTPSLVRFHFRNVQIRLRYEVENSREHQEHQKRILEMARQDYLTGLATRWYLQEFIEANKHTDLTCIYLDLDNFKGINDTYGHHAGDRALAATAEMMENEFPDGFAARMGGDEFMLVLTGSHDIKDVRRRVDAFMKKLTGFYESTKTMKQLSVSAGISQTTHESVKDIDQIIHEADQALYSAKKSGKAKSEIYTPTML